MSSAFLRLLIFLLAIWTPACASYSLAFYMIYSEYKLNQQGDNIQPWYTPIWIWNQPLVPGPVLTVVSWPADRFLRRQVRWSGIPTSLGIFHSCCDPHSQRLGIINKAEIDVFLELSCFFNIQVSYTSKRGRLYPTSSPLSQRNNFETSMC